MRSDAINIQDRVRENTSDEKNRELDQSLVERMDRYRNLSLNEINKRLEKLQKKWDIEKTLEVNASSLALTGLFFGIFFNRKWLALPVVVSAFLLQHGLQGWCPPLPLFRYFGIRTRAEIDEEIYALKALRGDFDNISSTSNPDEIMASFRK
jgi:hypothetical protein